MASTPGWSAPLSAAPAAKPIPWHDVEAFDTYMSQHRGIYSNLQKRCAAGPPGQWAIEILTTDLDGHRWIREHLLQNLDNSWSDSAKAAYHKLDNFRAWLRELNKKVEEQLCEWTDRTTHASDTEYEVLNAQQLLQIYYRLMYLRPVIEQASSMTGEAAANDRQNNLRTSLNTIKEFQAAFEHEDIIASGTALFRSMVVKLKRFETILKVQLGSADKHLARALQEEEVLQKEHAELESKRASTMQSSPLLGDAGFVALFKREKHFLASMNRLCSEYYRLAESSKVAQALMGANVWRVDASTGRTIIPSLASAKLGNHGLALPRAASR
jgi:hypothetical protein